ncbi:MAG: chitinase [Eubacterium sp.]|jgi:internalin A|nr:chitinase [Eubacterium sp.]
MKLNKIIISMLLVFAMLVSFVPNLTLETEAASIQKLGLHAFYPAQVTFSDASKKYIDSLDSVSFAWGRIYSDLEQGVVTGLGKNGNTMFYYPDDYVEVLKYAKSKNKPVQLNIFTDSVNAAAILPFKEQRDKAVNAIFELLKSDVGSGQELYFDGVVIDFEGLQNKDIKGNIITIGGKTISSWYVDFLKELKSKLKTINKTMFVAVNPLLNYSGYDYKEIAAAADKMIIMAHDYEPVTKLTRSQVLQYTGYNSVSPIDSLAPIKKIKLTLEDVKKYVDKANLYKVMLQINFDAAQWRFSVPTEADWNKTAGAAISMEARNTPTYEMIYNRVQNADGKAANLSYGYNNELESPFLQFYNVVDRTYNVALYENSRSIKAKLELVKEYGLGGVSLWSLANVPDYTDKVSKTYGLDVWDSITAALPIKSAAAPGTKVSFADKVVETAVRKQLMKPTGTIYSNDLSRVYRLAVPAGVKSLVDLKKLNNLEYLDLANTKITNIAHLANLKNLRVLYLQRNSISDITPLKGLTKMEVLSLNGNRISNISPVAALTSLTELYIRDNRISDYSPLANLKKLNILYLAGNKSTNYGKLSIIKKGLLESDFK